MVFTFLLFYHILGSSNERLNVFLYLQQQLTNEKYGCKSKHCQTRVSQYCTKSLVIILEHLNVSYQGLGAVTNAFSTSYTITESSVKYSFVSFLEAIDVRNANVCVSKQTNYRFSYNMYTHMYSHSNTNIHRYVHSQQNTLDL